MRPRRQVRRLEGLVRVLRPHEFDLAASFRQGGRQDREAAAHGLQVGAGDVEEQIPRVRRELRQDPVDHRRETQAHAGGVGDDREVGLRLDEMGIRPTFLVLREDLREVHLLRQPEWRKADGLRSDRLVREGRRDAIEVVDPDGHFLPLASHAHVELLLQVDDRAEEVVVEFEAADDAADRKRSDVRDAPFDDEVKARDSDRVYGEALLDPEEPPQPAGDPFDGIEVRPIREDVERHHLVLDTFGPRAHVRDPIDALLKAQTLPEQVDEILVSNVDVGQGRADIVSLFIQYRGPRHSMIEGGVRSGVPRGVAYKLTLRTMKGTAELLLIDGLEPRQLFRMVATPNGTTEAGWKVMEAR